MKNGPHQKQTSTQDSEMINPERFLEDLSGRYAHEYEDAMLEMAVAIGTGNKVALAAQRERLNNVINDTMGVAEVIGATLALQDAAALIPKEGYSMKADAPYLMAFATQNLIPKTTLEAAVQDLVDRVPYTLRRAADRTAQRLSQLYARGHPTKGRPVIAFSRSAEAKVTKRVQEIITEAVRAGDTEVDAAKRIVRSVAQMRKKSKRWTESYARMVFRTNANTAVTAGRFRQAQDPDIKAVIPCFQFVTVRDDRVRDNHERLDGRVFKVDNPVWDKIAPPLGFNCRCKLRNVSYAMLKRMGRLTSDGRIKENRVNRGALSAGTLGPGDGFSHGGRPDLLMVAAAGL